ERARLDSPQGWLFGLAFSPDGKLLAVGDGVGAVHLWDPATGEGRGSLSPERTEFRPPPSYAVTFTADGTRLLRARRNRLEWWAVAELTQSLARKPQPLTP